MTDGELLRNYIDNQHKSKISIAKDLGISKQTLFQYFKSRALTDEIRRRFETYFGKQIFRGERSVVEEGVSTYYEQKKDPLILEDLAASNKALAFSHQELAESNKILAKNTEELIAMLKVSLGRHGIAPVQDLQGPPLPKADYGPAKMENLKDKKHPPSRDK